MTGQPKKITEFQTVTSTLPTDVIPLVREEEVNLADKNKKITISNLFAEFSSTSNIKLTVSDQDPVAFPPLHTPITDGFLCIHLTIEGSSSSSQIRLWLGIDSEGWLGNNGWIYNDQWYDF